ncbi:hypothetical protein M405DRAFT_710985, partial [Rhizopogon salebrosus TDB-379]
ISFKLRDVLYVPDASHNLVSISQLDREGRQASICNGELKLYSKSGAQFAHAKMEKGLYILSARARLFPSSIANIAQHTSTRMWKEWH